MNRPPRTLGLLLALSRAPHAALDVATPAVAALLWARGIPPLRTILLGLPTALAGYLAVYALNDLVDVRADTEKMRVGYRDAQGYLDAALTRHPLASGLLRRGTGMAWAAALAALAATGSLLLNPVCALILLLAAALETLYCLLSQVTCLRVLVSGLVKTLGPVAAVYAVDRAPGLPHLALLAVWLFLFEVGGQNIPADWTDTEEDHRASQRTVPLRIGERASGKLALGALCASVAASVTLILLRNACFAPWTAVCSGVAGLVLLVFPAGRLASRPDRTAAMALFTRASLYPAAVLLGVGGLCLLALVFP